MIDVSVIVPVYNSEKYLIRCLDSILNQTYDRGGYDIYCIDDGSNDNSIKILEKYKYKYEDIIHIIRNDKNIGQGQSRMKAIYQSDCKYVMFIDSDDYISPDYIETYVLEADNYKCDMVVGGYMRDINGTLKKRNIRNNIWTLTWYVNPWAKIFKRGFIVDNNIEFYNTRVGEDVYFSMQVFCADPVYKIIDYNGYHWFCNDGSASQSITFDKKYEIIVSQLYGDLLKDDVLPYSETERRMIEYSYIANMLNALITYGHGCGYKIMREKYDFFLSDLREKFPDYRNNPYFGIFKPKGQNTKIRLAVGTTMTLHRFHLDRILFWLISLM